MHFLFTSAGRHEAIVRLLVVCSLPIGVRYAQPHLHLSRRKRIIPRLAAGLVEWADWLSPVAFGLLTVLSGGSSRLLYSLGWVVPFSLRRVSESGISGVHEEVISPAFRRSRLA